MQTHIRGAASGLLAFVLVFSAGCGGDQPTPPEAAPAQGEAAAVPSEQPTPQQIEYQKQLDALSVFAGDTSTAEVALGHFLQAVHAGNHLQAEQLLSDIARVETATLTFQPPRELAAPYDVKHVEYVGENQDGARLYCELKDPNVEKQGIPREIVWVMRLDKHGWRVAGMAFRPFPDEDLPLVLNFEDPADMQRKRELVEAEMIRREEAAAGTQVPGEATGPAANQARQPNTGNSGLQR